MVGAMQLYPAAPLCFRPYTTHCGRRSKRQRRLVASSSSHPARDLRLRATPTRRSRCATREKQTQAQSTALDQGATLSPEPIQRVADTEPVKQDDGVASAITLMARTSLSEGAITGCKSAQVEQQSEVETSDRSWNTSPTLPCSSTTTTPPTCSKQPSEEQQDVIFLSVKRFVENRSLPVLSPTELIRLETYCEGNICPGRCWGQRCDTLGFVELIRKLSDDYSVHNPVVYVDQGGRDVLLSNDANLQALLGSLIVQA